MPLLVLLPPSRLLPLSGPDGQAVIAVSSVMSIPSPETSPDTYTVGSLYWFWLLSA